MRASASILAAEGPVTTSKPMDKIDFWHVYIIECIDKKLYVGIAKDLDKRIKLHNKGLACRFTKYRKPVKLLYKEAYNTKSTARNRELEIKGYNREKKIDLSNK